MGEEGDKFQFHICEYQSLVQTFIKYLLFTRHEIKHPDLL